MRPAGRLRPCVSFHFGVWPLDSLTSALRKIPVNDGDASKARLELREENPLNHNVVRD
ncbi:Hypothetical predicted protein [Lynx pardinus]|uniref:Uncharacterized protein n=1 Tax=Lynx pardinus TaxID=191816 RepID=A0A485N884_LYNPA|nr:Hypothetical predicted protein [Lynx pardinus]